ncbi:MAG TPA: 3-hydroxyacyl-CoA dehydrogenase NAD-binding domain-containing protein, partial [Thermoleophilaceae bacterium]|nr:3-hydroxyacyl-CoA dehydrogenase NAD-binding domain-containing protein [Thermoleophilaceae bacterium]
MTVGIVGLGYVGLPLAVAFAEEGVEVVGVDVDARKVEALRAGRSYVEDVADRRVAAASERIHPTTRYAELARVEAIMIAVPTPLTANREPDLGPLVDATRSLAGVLQHG